MCRRRKYDAEGLDCGWWWRRWWWCRWCPVSGLWSPLLNIKPNYQHQLSRWADLSRVSPSLWESYFCTNHPMRNSLLMRESQPSEMLSSTTAKSQFVEPKVPAVLAHPRRWLLVVTELFTRGAQLKILLLHNRWFYIAVKSWKLNDAKICQIYRFHSHCESRPTSTICQPWA